MPLLQPGTPAPDFTLKATPDQTLKLSELRGRPVVLMFYPADWSPVCSSETALFNEVLSEFERLGAVLLGISADNTWCHEAFGKSQHLRFSLLSDFEPKGEVGRAFGVYDQRMGTEQRALFVIDRDGIIRWNQVSPTGINPGVAGVLDALEGLGGKAVA